VQNGFAGLSGVVGPLVTGVLIDATGDYRAAFLVAAGVAMIGLISWGLIIRRVEPLAWSEL
jgi:ACS family D-galactonate transporter-like MFS transporter